MAVKNGKNIRAGTMVSGLPEPYIVAGTWLMILEGYGFEKVAHSITELWFMDGEPVDKTLLGHGALHAGISVAGTVY